MAVMSHDGSSLPFDFKFPFENACTSILIKSKLINEMTNQLRQQMKNEMQVKAEINFKCKFWLNFNSENEV